MASVSNPGKPRRPTDADLAATLGRAKRYWDELLAHAREVSPGSTAEWKCYAGKYGWTLVVRGKRRNLIYLKLGEKCFTASLALSDEALEAARDSDLPAELVKSIAESPKYPEGRAARIEVRTAADCGIARRLLAIKAAH